MVYFFGTPYIATLAKLVA